MPNRYDPDQVAVLIKTLQEADTEMRSLRVTMEEANKRSKAALIVAALGVLVGLIGIYAGLTAHQASNKANEVAMEFEAQQKQTLISACVQFNVQRAELRDTFKKTLRSLAPVPDEQLTAQQKTQLTTYSAAVDTNLPFRDCSDAGIEQYYSNPPADPNGPH
jgi:hypothetical protein